MIHITEVADGSSSLAKPCYECRRKWIAIHSGLKLGKRVNLSLCSETSPLRRMKTRRVILVAIFFNHDCVQQETCNIFLNSIALAGFRLLVSRFSLATKLNGTDTSKRTLKNW